MRTLKVAVVLSIVVALSLSLGFNQAYAQRSYGAGSTSLLTMDRGVIWDSWTGTSHGLSANYAWPNKKMDYPGFEPGIVQAEIGTWPTSLWASNWSFIALRSDGIIDANGAGDPHPDLDVMGLVNHWEGLKATNREQDADSTIDFIQPISAYRWENGENYHLRFNPLEAEEVIDAYVYRYPGFRFGADVAEEDRHFLPIDVNINVRMWNGSRQDQRYQIEQLTLKNNSDEPGYDGNTGDDVTMFDTFVMHNYFGMVNHRSTSLLSQLRAPSDNDYLWNEDRNMMVMWDDDWTNPSSPQNDKFDFVKGMGPESQGEWAASGFLGFGYLYTSVNKNGKGGGAAGDGNPAHTHNFWNARLNNPGMGTDNPYQGTSQWNIVVNGFRTAFALGHDPKSPEYGNALFTSHITTGPWDIAPGEEIKIVQFQGIGAVDLELSMQLDRTVTEAEIATGLDSVYNLWDKAQLTTRMAMESGYATGGMQYEGWNMPDPPGVPFDAEDFTIAPYRGDNPTYGNVPANIITWDDWADTHPDPDYTGAEALDLANYTVWKSEYLPFMGWRALARIEKGSTTYYNATTGKYQFYDTDVKIGFSYYYALSTSDAGHDTWPPRPEALTEYPNLFPMGHVPPMQSSIQSSLNYHLDISKWSSFRTQRNPGVSVADIRVFPNPFVMRAGFINPGEEDGIHFVNIPADCVIRIYSVRGDLVATGPGSIQIIQESGSGEAVWKQLTISEQFVESGLYFYHIEANSGPDQGQTFEGKFVIIR